MKMIYTSILIVLLSVAAYGQASVGFKGGLNLSTINHGEDLNDRFDNLDRPFQTGFNFSFGADYYLTETLYLYTELMFTQKGDKYKGTGTAMDADFGEVDLMEETEVTLNYLEWPILARFKLGELDRFYINVGPTLGYWAGGHIKYEFQQGTETESFKEKIVFKNRDELTSTDRGNIFVNEDVNRFEAGAVIGAGAMLGPEFNRVNIDIRYTVGLTGIFEGGGFNQEDTWKNNVISISLGYFWIDRG